MTHVTHMCRHHEYGINHSCLCPRTRDHVQLADIYHLPIEPDLPLFDIALNGEIV
jgi:hypothetical protein